MRPEAPLPGERTDRGPLPELGAEGERVWVRTVHPSDAAGYRVAVQQSRHRLEHWNLVDEGELDARLRVQSRDRRSFVIHARQVEGAHDIVGQVNVTNVQRARFQSGSLGYDAYDPYAGRGLFAEGLALVVSLALADESAPEPGMGLHRVEASVQPGNVRSAAVLRSLGFRIEGRSPRMLWLPDASGEQRWRDHLRFAVTREDWPTTSYAVAVRPRPVVLVDGPSPHRARLALELAQEMALPLLGPEVPRAAVWTVLRTLATGAVLHRSFTAADAPLLRAGLASAGLGPADVQEIWCDSPEAFAEHGNGVRRRRRGPWARRTGAGSPALAQGRVHRLRLAEPVSRGELVRLALTIGASTG